MVTLARLESKAKTPRSAEVQLPFCLAFGYFCRGNQDCVLQSTQNSHPWAWAKQEH